MKFEEVFGCDIITHKIYEAIPGHMKILNTSDAEFEEWLQTRPVCMWCGEPIQDDTALELGNGWICNSCVEDNTHYIE